MLIDSHAHLDDEQFHDELPALIAQANAAGVERIVSVATTASSSATCVMLASRFAPTVLAAVGIHPNSVIKSQPSDWDEIVRLSAADRVVALGETGLDRHWDDTPFPLQEEYFARHLALSRTTGLAVVIHCREADADVLRILRADFDRHGPVQAVMHSFAGDFATATACLEMGLFVSFSGMVTFKNAEALRATAKQIPLDRLLVETDCPYLAPVPVRGKRNEPAYVAHTAACLAQLHGIELKLLAEHTSQNARVLFGIK